MTNVLPYLKFAGPVLDEATIGGVADVLRSGQLTSGPWVRQFEASLSAFCEGRPVRALTSATAAIEVALQLCGVGHGDEVITAAQSFFTVLNMIVKVGARPVFVDCDLITRNIDLAAVERAITPRTKLLILNSPSNPSGRVLPPDEFRRIMELTTERGIYVVSDECYLRFVYPPGEVFSAASLPAELRSRLCIAGSFSKTYAMTGWRVGYALAPAEWTKAMLKVQGHSTSNTNSIAQWAAVEALTGPQESVGIMLKEYTARRQWLLNALSEIPGFKCNEPEGAFYAFPDVRGCLRKDLKTSGDFAQRLLEEEHTVVTDGAGFGAEGFLRISYATSMEQIQEGVKRIKRFAEKH